MGVNRSDIADQLKSELVIIQEFLPKAIFRKKPRESVVQAIAEIGARQKRLGFGHEGCNETQQYRLMESSLETLASELLAH